MNRLYHCLCVFATVAFLLGITDVCAQMYTPTRIGSQICVLARWAGFTPAGDRIVFLGCDRDLHVWAPGSNADVSRYRDTLRYRDDVPFRFAFSRDGRRAISVGIDAVIWDAENWRPLLRISEKREFKNAVFSADGEQVITIGDPGIFVWDVATGRLLASLQEPGTYAQRGLDLSPDGRTLVASNDKGRVWTMSFPEGVAGWESRNFSGSRIALFSSDGTRILSQGYKESPIEMEAYELDAADGSLGRRYPGHTITMSGSRYSPDGATIMTTAVDSTVRIFSTTTGELLTTIRPGMQVYWGAFSPDGQRIVLAGRGAVQLWDLFGTTGVSSPKPELASNRLLDILPNPASTEVDVPFELARACVVRLSVVNALGVEVAAVAGREFGAGAHSLRLDLSGLESGAYWCVMRTERGRVSAPIRVFR